MNTLKYDLKVIKNYELRNYLLRSQNPSCLYSEGFKRAIEREVERRRLSC